MALFKNEYKAIGIAGSLCMLACTVTRLHLVHMPDCLDYVEDLCMWPEKPEKWVRTEKQKPYGVTLLRIREVGVVEIRFGFNFNLISKLMGFCQTKLSA